MDERAKTSGKVSLHELAKILAQGGTTSRSLVEQCLTRIDDPSGEGPRTFLELDREGALAQADLVDGLRKNGRAAAPYAGIPISVKDLFDIAGQVTRAGSRVLADARPAKHDASAVARLRAAGMIVLGRTNMTEFAYSGIGTNPHYGTPANPWDRTAARIPGGSSSGAAVSVTDGMAFAGLGTDTGGSCRIPAALCGIVGYKPSAQTVPQAGALPLSSSLDSVGALATSVADCALLYDILRGGHGANAPALPLGGIRVLAPRNYILDGTEDKVMADFDRVLLRLSDAGVRIVEEDIDPFDGIPAASAKGGFPAAEAYAWHQPLLAERSDEYDPRVRVRILRGKEQNAADYIQLIKWRGIFIRRVSDQLALYDAAIMPTMPLTAPTIASLEHDDEAYNRVNLLMLRNPTTVNLFDGCGVSVPMHEPGTAPTGLTIAAPNGQDNRVLRIARAVEETLSSK